MTELFVKDAGVRSGRRILIANLAFRKRGKGERRERWERRDTLSPKAKMEKLLMLNIPPPSKSEDFSGYAHAHVDQLMENGISFSMFFSVRHDSCG